MKREELFVYCKTTCDPQGLYYSKSEVDAAIAELKSEADKVIVEKDKEIAELKADYKEACDRLQTANLIKDEQLAATRHQKYKRCLAMARLCLRQYLNCNKYKITFWLKWHKRWLELAEKFKEEK